MYITGLQMSHGIGLDGETRHRCDPDNNDEYLGDTRGDFIIDQELYCQPLAQSDGITEGSDPTAFDEYVLTLAVDYLNENTPVETIPVIDYTNVKVDPIIDCNPLVVVRRNNTTKEDSTMSQSQPKTNPNHRPVITQNEEGTQVHVDVDQLAEHSQARLSYRQVFDLARKMAATAVSLREQAISSIARFHVQNMRNKGRTWIKASSWNAAINDETKIAQVEKKLNTKAQRELAKKARANPTTYKVTWNQLIEAIRNPDNADPKLKKILSRTTVGRKEIVVNKAQFDQITSLAA